LTAKLETLSGVSGVELEEAQPQRQAVSTTSATPVRIGADATHRPVGKLAAMADRWATFDCYGTLIDWNGGIRGQLARVFGEERADALLVRYHVLEPMLEADGTRSYREVLTEAMRGLGAPPEEEDALAQSLPSWQPFPEVPAALMAARGRGWKLAILSNTDRDYIEASLAQLGVPFEVSIVASEIGSYKPALGHWRAFEERVGGPPDVHVAASLFHDVAPANELGLPSIWINRLGETSGPQPTRELPDLTRLADMLEEVA
jgi:2-haloalkanoic acid dehalogenase type II